MKTTMRLRYVFLVIITLLSLGACYPGSTAPTQTISPVGTTQMVTTAPAIISATIIPITEEAFTPTPTRAPIRVTETSEEVQEVPMPVTPSLTITIIYDNNLDDPRLASTWGFSALIEYRDHTLLFDTGGDGKLLMENMRTLEIDPTQIDSVVLSHAHEDHTGGLITLLNTGIKPVVYLLASFPSSFKHQIEQYTQVYEVSPGQSIAEGLWTTGEMGATIPEQALVIQTEQGLVVITGCAHPGIVAIVERARELFAEPVRLVLGGFHLGNKSDAEINAILTDFRRLEVEQVAPCHCSGENAISMFVAEYGDDFFQIGVGSVIRLDE
jgi:7,8-dihydropterin-6-yl-methyl-4-(beta-D-ribofuranosyl)aminobenzene 5'-phosphate synthase